MNLFAYGTLMDEEIMAMVVGCRPIGLHATLADHRRHALRDKTYPALVPEKGTRVVGICYRDLQDLAWQGLDLFEGDMYQRVTVQVCTSNNHSLAAETYLLRPPFHHLLAEMEWSFADFLKSDKAAFVAGYCGVAETG